ncbi:hypothetical protein BaRGS_00005364 [Batillaria attramentaria]|uniref:Uncharacterized protein n=1 Tax=Batillaria attramentaria TaxID=370345 RepID=A0ABD0LW60_9CAEN
MWLAMSDYAERECVKFPASSPLSLSIKRCLCSSNPMPCAMWLAMSDYAERECVNWNQVTPPAGTTRRLTSGSIL